MNPFFDVSMPSDVEAKVTKLLEQFNDLMHSNPSYEPQIISLMMLSLTAGIAHNISDTFAIGYLAHLAKLVADGKLTYEVPDIIN